jgi:large repetitive protein
MFTARSAVALTIASMSIAAGPAAAALVSAVGATTNMGSGFNTDIINTINGNGLSSLALNATHAGSSPSNSWVSLTPAITGQVTFDLGGSFLIDGFSFWNQNGGGPGALGSTGINGVTILGSSDGVTFNPIAGAPAFFAQQPTTVAVAPQVITFGSITVSRIRFQILSNWGDVSQTGFAEVQFNVVPAPATGLLALSFAAFLRRRR